MFFFWSFIAGTHVHIPITKVNHNILVEGMLEATVFCISYIVLSLLIWLIDLFRELHYPPFCHSVALMCGCYLGLMITNTDKEVLEQDYCVRYNLFFTIVVMSKNSSHLHLIGVCRRYYLLPLILPFFKLRVFSWFWWFQNETA